jgi:beta-xylosidase
MTSHAVLPAESTYTNPIGGTIRGADPAVLRHEGRYYMYTTGYSCNVSDDLVTWKHVGRLKPIAPGGSRRGGWAPEVIHYRDSFYMVYCTPLVKGEGMRICLARGDKPTGPFSEVHGPLFDNGWACIDGHIFVDDGGTPYLYFTRVDYVNPANGRREARVHAAPLKRDLSGLADDPTVCMDTYQAWEDAELTGNWCNEGPFVVKHGQTYYMMFSTGHYRHQGYSLGYATAPGPLGPWAKADNNPVVKMDLAAGIAGPGHNCIVESPDRTEWFIVYHTHISPAERRRCVAIDRLFFGDDHTLSVKGPTRTPQPLPTGATH